LGKMQDVATREGRTILFVSHNLAAISELATRAVLLNAGAVEVDGDVARAISTYLSNGTKSAIYERSAEQTQKLPHVHRAEVITSNANGVHSFGEPLEIRFLINYSQLLSRGCFSFQIVNQSQQPVIHAWALYPEVRIGTAEGETVLVCKFPSLRLNVGQFYLRTYLTEPPGGEIYEQLDGICPFEVVRTDEAIVWGWHPEACSYHERWEWVIYHTKDVESSGARLAQPDARLHQRQAI
jgi:lipopolysaccharide transport system ATP-binding protein